MNELQKLIEKWDKQIALHIRVCEDTLMYTKEERLRNSNYAKAICAVIADLKSLTTPSISGSQMCPNCGKEHDSDEWNGYCSKTCWWGF